MVRDHKGLVGGGLVAVSSRQATLSMDGCMIDLTVLQYAMVWNLLAI